MQETQQEMQHPRSSGPDKLLESMQQGMEESRLTAVEIGNLWFAYTSETLAHHLFVYFRKHMENPVIKPLATIMVDESRDELSQLKTIFTREDIPLPRGIAAEDIYLDAPRLFSDNLFIPLVRMMARAGLRFYTLAYTDSTRSDIREYFHQAVKRFLIHTQQAAELMQAKGIPPQPPQMPVPEQVDFVKKQGFMAGFFAKKRPLTALEINNIFFNAKANAFGKALLLGFSQVAQAAPIKQFIIKGENLANKFFTDLNKALQNENITVPPSFDGEVLDSTESPFSDRLMLLFTAFMNTIGLQRYGRGSILAMCQRRDLNAMFARMIMETGALGNEGSKLLIDRGWLEQPPLAPDRQALAEQGSPPPDKQLH
ncbi:MAG: DUF3231 family protein [Candidatus Syntrophopropionicum ammoniitolerans]